MPPPQRAAFHHQLRRPRNLRPPQTLGNGSPQRLAVPIPIERPVVIGLAHDEIVRARILRGLIDNFHTPLVVATVLSIALAFIADVGIAGVQRVAIPWARAA